MKILSQSQIRNQQPFGISTSKPTCTVRSRKSVMEGESFNYNFSLNEIEEHINSQSPLALYRIRLLGRECDDDNDGGVGFAALFLPILRQSIEGFMAVLKSDNIGLLSKAEEAIGILQVLTIYRKISEIDPVLDEEIGREGAHFYLSRIIKLDMYSIDCCSCNDDDTNEANQDAIIEIQDLACEIAAYSKSFPLQAVPFMREDLLARLPLVFNIHPVLETCDENEYENDGITVLVNQVPDRQSAQKDVGFVMWPSAVVLSRWLVSNPTELYGKTVLELGAGCGLTGLVASKIIQDFTNKQGGEEPSSSSDTESSNCGSVILSDFNETVVKNLKGNIALNDLSSITSAEGLDFYQQDPEGNGRITIDGVKHTDLADVIIAADVICQPEDAFAAARSIAAALKEGGKAIVVSADSKHRFGVEKLEEACLVVGSLSILSKSSVENYLCNNADSEDVARDEDMEKTSGFVPGMALTMYVIQKIDSSSKI